MITYCHIIFYLIEGDKQLLLLLPHDNKNFQTCFGMNVF
jgi:hypothetical protein